MQTAPAQLEAALQRGIKPLYTVMGDEPLQVEESLDAIRKAARANGYTERSVHIVQGAHFNWSEVLAAGNAMSLFADKQIVEIRIPSGKPGKEGSEALQRIAEDAAGNDSTLTLIALPKLDWTNLKSAWYTALEANGVVVKVDAIERRALPAWIAQRLQTQGLKVASGEDGQHALQFIADRIEGNLLAAQQEIAKLGLLFGKPGETLELSFEQIEASVANVARYDVFKLGEAVLSGQLDRLQRMLDGLQGEGEAEVLVSNQLAGDLRALRAVRARLDSGLPMPLALKEAGVWRDKQQLYERALPRLSLPMLDAWVAQAHALDGVVKGLKRQGLPKDAWSALRHLCFEVAKAR
jgi:DNA polymerase III subunit delta